MTTFTNYDDRFNALPPERQARIQAKALAMQASIRLAELRKEQNTTQQKLAEKLHVSQSNVAQMEGRGDIQLSVLLQYAHALGATLNIELVMPDGAHRSLLGGA